MQTYLENSGAKWLVRSAASDKRKRNSLVIGFICKLLILLCSIRNHFKWIAKSMLDNIMVQRPKEIALQMHRHDSSHKLINNCFDCPNWIEQQQTSKNTIAEIPIQVSKIPNKNKRFLCCYYLLSIEGTYHWHTVILIKRLVRYCLWINSWHTRWIDAGSSGCCKLIDWHIIDRGWLRCIIYSTVWGNYRLPEHAALSWNERKNGEKKW